MKSTKPPKTARKVRKAPATTRLEPKKSGAEGKGKRRKEPFGRPTDFKPEYVEQAYKLCLMGMTDVELASFFEIAESNLNEWKHRFPDFQESMRRGKEIADAEVSASLYQRALGYSHPEVHISNYQGSITETPLTKHYPPDTAAASLWLRNRQSGKWRDKVDVDHGLQPGSTLENLMGKLVEQTDTRARPAS